MQALVSSVEDFVKWFNVKMMRLSLPNHASRVFSIICFYFLINACIIKNILRKSSQILLVNLSPLQSLQFFIYRVYLPSHGLIFNKNFLYFLRHSICIISFNLFIQLFCNFLSNFQNLSVFLFLQLSNFPSPSSLSSRPVFLSSCSLLLLSIICINFLLPLLFPLPRISYFPISFSFSSVLLQV